MVGDTSPKSIHKKAAPKRLRTNAAAQKKQQAVAAKQIAGEN